MEALAAAKNIDEELMASWLTCTFVYMRSQDDDAFTLQLASVAPDLTVELTQQYVVPKAAHRILSCMYRPAIVFAPSFVAHPVVWSYNPDDNHDTPTL